MKTKICLGLAVSLVAFAVCAEDALARFWRENDGKTVRRLPVQVMPENVFWSFGTRDFSEGMKTFGKLMDEGLDRSTYNCITLTLRCNPELGDAETLAAAKQAIAKAHAQGVKVYMDTDPRIARREFFARWPEDRQSVASVTVSVPTNGIATFSAVFRPVQDHMSWGSRSAYRPLSGKVVSAFAAKRRADGALDFASRRTVEVESDVSLRDWREAARGGYGSTEFSEATVKGRAAGLAADEALVVVSAAEYFSADLFSPHLLPFCRELMERYRAVGADGGMRDEWGFIPEHRPDWRRFFYSPHFAKAYAAASGRDLLADFPLMAYGPVGDASRTAAIGAYMKMTLARNVEIEQDFYATDKRLFGADVYVAKHPTWTTLMGPGEVYHNGIDWWQATRDWAQGDEITPIYALNGMAKKFGGPVWLNEGYTPTPEQNAFRVWTYALCGGRQVFHGLFGGNRLRGLPWEESRVRGSLDLLAPDNLAAQTRVRLASLVTRAQMDSPVAFVFGHEELVDWSAPGFANHGRAQLAALMAKGWWADAYPASEFALGTFSVDADGWLRVGQQRYRALALWQLRSAEKTALDALTAGKTLRTRLFDGAQTDALAAYLAEVQATRQPCVQANTWAGPLYPAPDGALALLDGTVIRIAADATHLAGLPISDTLVSNGAKAVVEAEGLCAFRAEKGRTTAFAAGRLKRVSAPGLELVLDQPEDVVLRWIDGAWHGVWQTARRDAPVPAALLRLTGHWTRLLMPSQGGK